MKWSQLQSVSQLDKIDADSMQSPVVIFKHSTRCSVSSTALDRLNRNSGEDLKAGEVWYLDLIAHRDISNNIAERYDVIHESPQLMVIRNGKAVYVATHLAITYHELKQAVGEAV